jgi:hypothetical protein
VTGPGGAGERTVLFNTTAIHGHDFVPALEGLEAEPHLRP